MKLSTLSFFAVGAGLAQNVVSAPIRVVIVANDVVSASDAAGPVAMRFGHAVDPNVAPMTPSAHRHMSNMMGTMLHENQDGKAKNHHRPCPGMSGARAGMRSKAIEISNAFRQALGMPLLEDHAHAHPGMMKIKFVELSPPTIETAKGDGVLATPHPHHRHGKWMPKAQEDTFMRRFYFALMSLGPWEGRAVAFVLGCGIGVLLRMVWVLCVVSYRSLQGSDPSDEVIFAEELFVAPPQYTYTDEKTGDIKPKQQNEGEVQT